MLTQLKPGKFAQLATEILHEPNLRYEATKQYTVYSTVLLIIGQTSTNASIYNNDYDAMYC